MDSLHQPVSALHAKYLEASELYMALHTEVFYLFFRRDDIESLRRSHGDLLDHVSQLVHEWKFESYFLCRANPHTAYYCSEQSLKETEQALLDLANNIPFFASKQKDLVKGMKYIFRRVSIERKHMAPYFTTVATITVDHFEFESYNQKANIELNPQMPRMLGASTVDICIMGLKYAIDTVHKGDFTEPPPPFDPSIFIRRL